MLNYGLRLGNPLPRVEDCVQEVFVDLWHYREKLADPADLRFYLMKSLRNSLGKHHRQSQPFASDIDDETDNPFLTEPSSEQRLIELSIDQELQRRIHEMLNQLTPRQKQLIYLRYFQDFDYEQICELMDINYQTARSQHYNALKTLRSSLKNTNLPFCLFFLINFF